MSRIATVVALLAFGLICVEAQTCQECQSTNDVYCHNQTSYQYCMNNVAIGEVLACPTGTVCSNSEDACAATTAIDDTTLDVCGSGGSGCGVCDVSASKFSCVSQTQFVRCSSQNLPSASVFSCAAGEICITGALSTYNTLCVPSCAAEFLEIEATCSNSDYATTTTTAAPGVTQSTPATSIQQTECTDAVEANDSLATAQYFFTIYTADTTCSTYLYCERATSGDNTWTTVFITCPTAKPYFDSATSVCVATKPSTC
ncbi:hypothetical protein KR018_006978 [Drosophila ironensis]|nr:hypothetical protein KR018_006978 [Drosophila ironensis]